MKLIVRHEGRDIEVEVERYGAGYRVSYDGRVIEADVTRANLFLSSLCFRDGRQYLIGYDRDGDKLALSFGDQTLHLDVFDPLTLKRRRREDEDGGGAGVVKAIMPGRVVRVLVEEGSVVEKGAGLVILEAMKMENEIAAPAAGTVRKIYAAAGETVEGGADLVLIE